MNRSPPSSLKILGEGTFGKVFSMPDPNEKGSFIAVKVISYDKKGVVSPLELYIMQCLNHPNLAHANMISLSSGDVKIYSKLASSNLKSYLASHPGLSLSTKIRLMREIASVVQYLHSRNIVNADIKPNNILVFGKGDDVTLKVTDFSISMFLGKKGTTDSNAYSLSYKPPEVLKKMEWSYSADMWALGLTFYEILYGESLTINKLIREDNDIRAFQESWASKMFDPSKIKKVDNAKFDSSWTNPEYRSLNILILSLLQVNPQLRLTAEECVLHEALGSNLFLYSSVNLSMTKFNEPSSMVRIPDPGILTHLERHPYELGLSLSLFKNHENVSIKICAILCFKITCGIVPPWLCSMIDEDTIDDESTFLNDIEFKILSE